MKILIVLAHPEIQSMNGAMFEQAVTTLAAEGHEVKTSDLYRLQFDAVSDRSNFTSTYNSEYFKQQLEELHAAANNGFATAVETEQQKVEWCDLMIWQFPLWWFSVPGILKGWVDRVFAMGRFYGDGRFYETGVFKGQKKAILSLTTGTDPEAYKKGGLHGDLQAILRPIHRGMLEFTGFSVLHPHVIYGPVRQTPEQRAAELEAWSRRLKTVFDEIPMMVDFY